MSVYSDQHTTLRWKSEDSTHRMDLKPPADGEQPSDSDSYQGLAEHSESHRETAAELARADVDHSADSGMRIDKGLKKKSEGYKPQVRKPRKQRSLQERRSKVENEWQAQPRGGRNRRCHALYTGARGRKEMLMVVNSAMRCKDGRQMSRLHGALGSTWTGAARDAVRTYWMGGLQRRLPVLGESRCQSVHVTMMLTLTIHRRLRPSRSPDDCRSFR